MILRNCLVLNLNKNLKKYNHKVCDGEISNDNFLLLKLFYFSRCDTNHSEIGKNCNDNWYMLYSWAMLCSALRKSKRELTKYCP